ncbi:MAG: curli-like amyloid fiber formation chaperone CsgH [Nioella sp.]
MTLPLVPRRFLPAALILAGAGVAAACSTSTAATSDAATAPFACEIAVAETAAGTRFEARLQANDALSGSYRLRLAGRGTDIRQAGAFSARAGETLTLGQSMLSGAASAYDAELTVTVDGRSHRCGSPGEET